MHLYNPYLMLMLRKRREDTELIQPFFDTARQLTLNMSTNLYSGSKVLPPKNSRRQNIAVEQPEKEKKRKKKGLGKLFHMTVHNLPNNQLV